MAPFKISDSKCYYPKRAKFKICNNAVVPTNKFIRSLKIRFEDDSLEDIIQTAYKVLNSWTVMKETPKENTTTSRYETLHDMKNSGNENDEKIDYDDEEQSEDDNFKHFDYNNKH